MDNRIIQKRGRYFTDEEKHLIIQEYLSCGRTKQEIWFKYTGMNDHGHLLQWMRYLGYLSPTNSIRPNFTSNTDVMAKNKKQASSLESDDLLFENLQLKRRVSELENQLKGAEMKAIAFSAMIDIAEKEFKIPIKKKFNTKP
jgi:hypothetical protein